MSRRLMVKRAWASQGEGPNNANAGADDEGANNANAKGAANNADAKASELGSLHPAPTTPKPRGPPDSSSKTNQKQDPP